jgi:formylmethanofuran:tetrahydromethanopterin formyltransferase
VRIEEAVRYAAEATRIPMVTDPVENPDGFPGEAVSVEEIVTVSEDLLDRQIGYRVRMHSQQVLATTDLAKAAAKAVALIAEKQARIAVNDEMLMRAAG